jgi:hypothetical protein
MQLNPKVKLALLLVAVLVLSLLMAKTGHCGGGGYGFFDGDG